MSEQGCAALDLFGQFGSTYASNGKQSVACRYLGLPKLHHTQRGLSETVLEAQHYGLPHLVAH